MVQHTTCSKFTPFDSVKTYTDNTKMQRATHCKLSVSPLSLNLNVEHLRVRDGLTDTMLFSLLRNDSKVYRKANVHKMLNHLNAANRNTECHFPFHALSHDVMSAMSECDPLPHKSLMIDSFFHVFGQRPLPFHSF